MGQSCQPDSTDRSPQNAPHSSPPTSTARRSLHSTRNNTDHERRPKHRICTTAIRVLVISSTTLFVSADERQRTAQTVPTKTGSTYRNASGRWSSHPNLRKTRTPFSSFLSPPNLTLLLVRRAQGKERSPHVSFRNTTFISYRRVMYCGGRL